MSERSERIGITARSDHGCTIDPILVNRLHDTMVLQ